MLKAVPCDNIRKMASKYGEVSGALVSAYQDLERYKRFYQQGHCTHWNERGS